MKKRQFWPAESELGSDFVKILDPETRKWMLFRNPGAKQQNYYYSLADAWYCNATCKLVLRIRDVHPVSVFFFHPGSRIQKQERWEEKYKNIRCPTFFLAVNFAKFKIVLYFVQVPVQKNIPS